MAWRRRPGAVERGREDRWDGIPTGYEGDFVASWHALYAIAIEKGLLKPFTPEWWGECQGSR
jgi:hypothetical protein